MSSSRVIQKDEEVAKYGIMSVQETNINIPHLNSIVSQHELQRRRSSIGVQEMNQYRQPPYVGGEELPSLRDDINTTSDECFD